MASVKLVITSVDEKPVKIFQQTGCKGALTKMARQIASRANAMSADFRTGLWYPDNDRTKEPIGGDKPPKYKALTAINTAEGATALVVTGNYAAIKDCHEHNTLLKAKG